MTRRRRNAASRVYRLGARLRPGLLLPRPVALRLRRWVAGMPADAVRAAVDACDHAGVHAVVAGGWGIDILLGRQTRRHGDLDLIVSGGTAGMRAAERALAGLGYRVVDDHARGGHWMPVFVVIRDRAGRTIELLPTETRPDATTGTLAGCAIRCLSAGKQLDFHQGYRLSAEGVRDVDLLTRHVRDASGPGSGAQ